MKLKENSTTRYLLIAMVLAGGEITSDNARLCALSGVSLQNIYRTVNILKENRYIEEKVTANGAKYRLKLFKKYGKEYMSLLWKDAESFEPVLYGQDLKKGKRNLLLAELYFLMESAQIAVTPDEVSLAPDTVGETVLPFFVSSRDVRKVFATEDMRERMSRYNGLLVTLNGVFPVYNLTESMAAYMNLFEENAVKIADMVRRIYLPGTDKYLADSFRFSPGRLDDKNRIIKRGTVIVTDNYEALTEYFFIDGAGKTGSTKGIIYLSNFYDNIYVLPKVNVLTATILNMMSAGGWHKRLTDTVLGSAVRMKDSDRQVIDFDAEEDGKKVLCFIDGDIKRLKGAVQEYKGKTETIKVICFDYQKALLSRILPSNFELEVHAFEEVLGAYVEAFEKE